jgi:hypothetical protein
MPLIGTPLLGLIDFGSACGTLTLHQGDLRRDRICRVVEFAMSNAGIFPKINVIDKSDNIADASGNQCYERMLDDKPPPVFFSIDNSQYVVYAKIRGDTNSRCWCFVVQKYDPSGWSNSLINRLRRVLP